MRWHPATSGANRCCGVGIGSSPTRIRMNSIRLKLALACAGAAMALVAAPATAQTTATPAPYVPGEVIVGLEGGGTKVAELPAGTSVPDGIATLERDSDGAFRRPQLDRARVGRAPRPGGRRPARRLAGRSVELPRAPRRNPGRPGVGAADRRGCPRRHRHHGGGGRHRARLRGRAGLPPQPRLRPRSVRARDRPRRRRLGTARRERPRYPRRRDDRRAGDQARALERFRLRDRHRVRGAPDARPGARRLGGRQHRRRRRGHPLGGAQRGGRDQPLPQLRPDGQRLRAGAHGLRRDPQGEQRRGARRRRGR